MSIHVCTWDIDTHIIHMYVSINVGMYECMYVYAYMLYQCINLGVYIGCHLYMYIHTHTTYRHACIYTCVCMHIS